MKKILLSIAFTLIVMMSFSQAKIAIGIKGGANFASNNLDQTGVDTESITSLHAGAFGLIKLANIGIQPEILFSKQGADFSFTGGSSEFDLTYVNIPVMLKIYVPGGLNLQLGPQFGVLASAKDGDGEDIKESLKNSDMSAAFGAGWDAPFGLQVNARYILGLSDINDDPTFEPIKNRTFQISLGYTLFKLGR